MNVPIDEAALPALLDNFYSRVRADAELGPLCNQTPNGWPAQLASLADLWSALMLTSGGHAATPLGKCPRRGAAITLPIFERWLSLWRETAGELLPPDGATAMRVKAARLAIRLQRALGLCLAEA